MAGLNGGLGRFKDPVGKFRMGRTDLSNHIYAEQQLKSKSLRDSLCAQDV